jgi:hypothetical protein
MQGSTVSGMTDQIQVRWALWTFGLMHRCIKVSVRLNVDISSNTRVP